MVNKGELIDLNRRIENFEKLADEFAKIFSEDIGDARKIDELAHKMEKLREKLDEDLKEHHLKALEEDVKEMDDLDRMVDKLLVQDLKREAKAIDKELHDIIAQAEH
ncbi:MAG: hypothetical protein ABEK10_01825 [Candidatus Nanosalina sp.]